MGAANMNASPPADGRRKLLLGMPVDCIADAGEVVEAVSGRPLLLSYLNPLAWHVARSSPDYPRQLGSMDLVVCDGVAVRSAVRRFLAFDPAIVSLDFSGIGGTMLAHWAASGKSVCLVGAEEGVAVKAGAQFSRQFPGLTIKACFAGYGPALDEARDYVRTQAPDVVLAGLGMGLQERFLMELRASGWAGTGVCVGAFFDRVAAPAVDYPDWSVRYNVRFLGNVSRRPAYYLERYLLHYLPFYRRYAGRVLGLGKTRKTETG